MTFPTYEIRTVNDFLKIPTNRLDACLREFSTSLEIAKTISDSEMPEWTWVDDGDEKQTVELVFRDRAAAI